MAFSIPVFGIEEILFYGILADIQYVLLIHLLFLFIIYTAQQVKVALG